MRKYIIGFIGVALIAGLSFWALAGDRSVKGNFLTGKIERASISNRVSATGTLEAVSTVQVGSQTSGQISALYADYNAIVKKGQLLATLDSRPTESQVETARAHLAGAEAQLQSAQADLANQQADVAQAQANLRLAEVSEENAKIMYDRSKELDGRGLLSKNDLDTAKTTLDSGQAKVEQATAALQQSQATVRSREAAINSAKANIAAAKADLGKAQIDLDLTKIHSPIDGVVISRNVDVGQTVAASLQAPVLFTIANDLTQMQVKASVDEADIGKISKDGSVRFTVDAYPNDTFHGTISEIRLEPQTVQNVVTYNVIIGVANPDMKLRPGMTANLTVTVDKRDNVLVAPNAALRFTPQSSTSDHIHGSTIWILDSAGQPKMVIVHTGITDGSRTEVSGDGLSEGMPVIIGDLSKKDTAAATNSGRPSAGMPVGMPGLSGLGGTRGGGR